MCKNCVYKRICKFVEVEKAKTASDTPCQRFRRIPRITASEDEGKYLV